MRRGYQEVNHRDTDIVSAFRLLLRQGLGDDTYDLWFSATTLVAHDASIEVLVDSQFSLERIKRSFYGDLKKAAVGALGNDAKIKFLVSTPTAETKSNASAVVQPPRKNENLPKTSTKTIRTRRPFAALNSFVVGDCNRLSFGSADIVANDLGSVSPFFIHGPNGAGKTHLLEGIWSQARKQRRVRQVIYLSAEQFTTYFLQALKGGGLPSFRQKYRGVELLILDDLQFFIGKQATVVELLHTIDSNIRDGGQLVLAADRPVSEMHQLGTELTTRLTSGLVCEIQPLDHETRRDVLKRFAHGRKLELAENVLDELAAITPGDGRQLSGVINRLWVTSQVTRKPVTTTMVREVSSELFSGTKSDVRLMDIERVVCGQFGIDAEMLKSSNRTRNVSHPRMLAMWLARKHTRAALAEISEFFGRRSHSTVVSAQNKVESWVEGNAQVQLLHKSCEIRDVVQRIERELAVG